jgi:hypothetical protein
MEEQKKILDQLFGSHRTSDAGPKKKYTDSDVCKNFLLGCCPGDILANTVRTIHQKKFMAFISLEKQ